jgi:hypothetical protein
MEYRSLKAQFYYRNNEYTIASQHKRPQGHDTKTKPSRSFVEFR